MSSPLIHQNYSLVPSASPQLEQLMQSNKDWHALLLSSMGSVLSFAQEEA